MSTNWRRIAPLVLLALPFIAYSPFLPGTFLYDDTVIVRLNPLVQQWDLSGVFHSGWWWQGVGPDRLYRPLTVLTFALNRFLFGPGPLSFLLVNIGLHAAAGIALYRVLKSLPVGEPTALLAAALFVVHPMHVEVVSMAVGRTEILAALFVFLGLLSARGAGIRSELLTAGLFAAAMLSKENAVVFPLLLLLTDRFTDTPPGGITSRRRLYSLLLLVALSWVAWRAHLGLLALGTVSVHPADNPLAGMAPPARLLAAIGIQLTYLKKLLLPIDLQVLYGRSSLTLVTELLSVRGVLCALAAGALGVVIVQGWRRRAWYGWGSAWYLATFLATGNFLFPVALVMADRFAYLPSAGLLLAVAWIAFKPGELMPPERGPWGRAAVWLLPAALIACSGALIARRQPEFRSEETLWQSVVRRDAGNNWAWVNLGQALAEAGKLAEAEKAYLTSIELEPGTFEPYLSYGELLLLERRPQDALRWTLQGVRETGGGVPELHLRVIRAYLGLGDAINAALWVLMVGRADPTAVSPWQEVRALLEREIARPGLPPSDRALQLALHRLLASDPDGAAAEFTATIVPEDAVTAAVRGEIAIRQGRFEEAGEWFARAANLDPGSELNRLNLWIMLNRGVVPGKAAGELN